MLLDYWPIMIIIIIIIIIIGQRQWIKEVIHPQVPLQIPCVDLPRLAELRFELLSVILIQIQLEWVDGQWVQGTGTYSPCYAKTRLLGISPSRGWIAILDPNRVKFEGLASPFGVAARCINQCMPRAAQQIRGLCPNRNIMFVAVETYS